MNIEIISMSKMPVLICGPTGAGKSHFFRKIANKRAENGKKELAIIMNIAALRESLIESELFGHKKGSFTGAIKDKYGFFHQSKEGLLFIDEIGDLDFSLQTKLLQVLEEKIFYPVGSTHPETYNGKIVFATNVDLEKKVSEGRFREDLYFRIKGIQVNLSPINKLPLREKLQIIKDHFKEIIGCNLDNPEFTELKKLLLGYSWPGNLRELRNTLQLINEYISRSLKIPFDDLNLFPDEKESEIAFHNKVLVMDYYEALEEFERSFFELVLKRHMGRVNDSARAMNISKTTLIAKCKKYDISTNLIKHEAKFPSKLSVA